MKRTGGEDKNLTLRPDGTPLPIPLWRSDRFCSFFFYLSPSFNLGILPHDLLHVFLVPPSIWEEWKDLERYVTSLVNTWICDDDENLVPHAVYAGDISRTKEGLFLSIFHQIYFVSSFNFSRQGKLYQKKRGGEFFPPQTLKTAFRAHSFYYTGT